MLKCFCLTQTSYNFNRIVCLMLSPVQTAEASLCKVEIRIEHEQKLLRLTVRKRSYLVANKHIFLSVHRHQSDSPFVYKWALPRIKYFNSTQGQS